MNILIKMKNNGKAETTIHFTRKALQFLAKHADLNNPEQVKQFIANHEVSNHYKRNLCIAYNKYLEHTNQTWNMPLYRQPSKMPNIPTTAKLNMLISHAGKHLALRLKISMETGLRPIEVMRLKVKDVNFETRTLQPATAKNGAPRMIKLSIQTTAMLKAHISKYKRTQHDKIFKGTSDNYGKLFRQMRNNLAEKLQDPTIRNIRLYDLRHYYATRLYSKTKDILLVKQQMGHKKLETTLIYTQLLHFNEEDEYTCKTATNIKQATKLIENGFQYITEIDGTKLFRKRK